MKILVGTFEIGRHMHDLAAGFRSLGHAADTVAFYRNPQNLDLPYTHVLPPDLVDANLAALQRHPIDTLLRHGSNLSLVRELLTGYDLYVFQFASSLMHGNKDYDLLKQLGKKLACVFLGSDVRHWSGLEPICAHYGMSTPDTVYEEPYRQLNTRLHNLRIAERYADAIFSLPFQSELAIRPYWQVQLPLDLSLYEFGIPEREVPVIVHAPTRRGFKGTAAVIEALDRLKSEGEQFELRLLEGVSNAEVIRALTDAEMVVDQLHAPHYGMLGLEAMASGCAVIGGNVPGYVPMMRESPVVHASPQTIYDVAKLLIRDKNRRRSIAQRGRSYVEEFHSPPNVARAMLEKLDTRSAYEYYPTFYTTNYNRPEGETIHPEVLRLTNEVIGRYGLPAEADPRRLVDEGLAEETLLDEPLVRWAPLVDDAIREPWGWCPLHTAGESGEINHRAMIIEAAIEVRLRASQNDVQGAATLFQTCITEIGAVPDLASDEEVLVAVALAAAELELTDDVRGFVEKGLALHPESESLRACANRFDVDLPQDRVLQEQF